MQQRRLQLVIHGSCRTSLPSSSQPPHAIPQVGMCSCHPLRTFSPLPLTWVVLQVGLSLLKHILINEIKDLRGKSIGRGGSGQLLGPASGHLRHAPHR